MTAMSGHKCLLVGDGGTGKTSYVKRLVTGEFTTSYSATLAYEIETIVVHPSAAPATNFMLNVWDVSGQTSSGNLLREILASADCAIIFFDVTSRITFNHVHSWYKEIVQACGPNIPIVIVGNKVDMPARKIKTEKMLRKFPSSVKYYDVSVKTKFNIDEPTQWIVKKLLQISRCKTESDVLENEPEDPSPSAETEIGITLETSFEQSGCSTRTRMRGNANGIADKLLRISQSEENSDILENELENLTSSTGIEIRISLGTNHGQSGRVVRTKMWKSSNGSASNGALKGRNSPKRVNASQGKKGTKYCQ